MVDNTGPTSANVSPPIHDLPDIQQRVLEWFGGHARDLPWRHTRDPYAVLVSEIMLQQIQVARAIPFYLAFLDRFPTVEALAAAPISAVIQVWGDLGRYRRITNLHATAKRIVAEFGGVVPADVAVLRQLPGIGPYTAGAVACFAYEQDVGFLDTNARRVIHRIFIGSDVPAPTASVALLTTWANNVVPPGRGWTWNQAVIELGALVCRARRPSCEACPVADLCVARPTIAVAIAAQPKRTPAPRPAPEELPARPLRIYRGKVLARLRADSDGVDLPTLGAAIADGFSNADLPWLEGVLDSLRKDGLAAIAEDRPVYDPEFPSTDPNPPLRRVRLPE